MLLRSLDVQAEHGVAAGGNINARDINIGIRSEQLERLIKDRVKPIQELADNQKMLIVLLQEKLRLNESQVRTALAIAGETDVPTEKLNETLVSIANRFRTLQARISAMSDHYPEIAQIKEAILTAVENGDIDGADKLLANLQEHQENAANRSAMEFVDTLAQRGDIAFMRLRYLEAAHYFAAAAERVPTGYLGERVVLRIDENQALFRQGYERGDAEALKSAINGGRDIIAIVSTETAPKPLRLAAYNNLGSSLSALGERDTGTAHLKEAVATFHLAISECDRSIDGFMWGLLQKCLGIAFIKLAERDPSTNYCDYAVEAFDAALQELTRDQHPVLWGSLQNDIGAALQQIGEGSTGTARLEEAVQAFRLALLECTREQSPDDWAMIQNNLGNALEEIGDREASTVWLKEAVNAYHHALAEYTRERYPLDWARVQNNLGTALEALGKLEPNIPWFQEAAHAYRQALFERTRERTPFDWAMTQINLGNVLYKIGKRETGTEILHEAVTATRSSLEELTVEHTPLKWAIASNSLGTTLRLIGEREANRDCLNEAVTHLSAAVDTFERHNESYNVSIARRNCARAIRTLIKHNIIHLPS